MAAGEGKLTIKVAQDGGAVFVNEAYRGQGTTQLSLAPGDYRVLVMLNQQPSRTHYVSVRANSEATVTIDAELDQAIHTRGWTGFLFTNDAARDAHEAQFAATFANSIKAPSVAVISIEQVQGPRGDRRRAGQPRERSRDPARERRARPGSVDRSAQGAGAVPRGRAGRRGDRRFDRRRREGAGARHAERLVVVAGWR